MLFNVKNNLQRLNRGRLVFLFLILVLKILVELVCSEEYKKNSNSAYKNKQYPVPPGGELIEGNNGQTEDD